MSNVLQDMQFRQNASGLKESQPVYIHCPNPSLWASHLKPRITPKWMEADGRRPPQIEGEGGGEDEAMRNEY